MANPILDKPFEESWFFADVNSVGDRFRLPVAETLHIRKVLRIQPGRRVVASNGKGGVFRCETFLTKGDELELAVAECIEMEVPPPKLNMVLSLLKGKDLEEPIDGICQLNIRTIHLVSTDHSQEFKGQNYDRLVERLRAKSIVALKQSKKAWLTEIHAPISLPEWRNRFRALPLILAHPGKDRLPEHLDEEYAVLIGPEGGFSNGEISQLEKECVYTISLGETRIRGTHAPLLVCGKLLGLDLLR